MENLEPYIHYWWECKRVQLLWKGLEVPQKAKDKITA